MRIDISHLPYFRDEERLHDIVTSLNQQDTYMPHQLAAMSGLNQQEIETLLFLLFNRGMVKVHILTYHNTDFHDPVLISSTDITCGFPQPPIECPECDYLIQKQDELWYDYMFIRKMDFKLTIDG